MNYLHWDEKTITDFSDKNIADMYARGYVFTRIGRGVMHQTRSVRIDLSKFEPSSENRRVLKKVAEYDKASLDLPLKEYDLRIGKLAKDFYDTKFGPGIMSAQKIKEMLTDASKSNFNELLVYAHDRTPVGYVICYENEAMVHYSYPFYDLNDASKDMGLGMMMSTIDWAKNDSVKHIYLGSLQRPGDTYKLQFEGLEWFDGGPGGSGVWQSDLDAVKKLLKE
jgi:arginyl-tRNA--protein-N-Asp/Glu arginylyltransferase